MNEDKIKKFADRQIGGTEKRLNKKYVIGGWAIAGLVVAALIIGFWIGV